MIYAEYIELSTSTGAWSDLLWSVSIEGVFLK